MQRRFFVCAITCVAALQLSSGLVAGGPGDGNLGAPGHVSGRSGGSKNLTVTKDCGARPAEGELPYCTITASNFPPLVDAKIRYFGPKFFTETQPYLESWVVIESAREGAGTAFGHCLVRGVPGVLGACQFTGGSGSLKGFKADVTVTTVDFTIWYWNGSRSNDD